MYKLLEAYLPVNALPLEILGFSKSVLKANCMKRAKSYFFVNNNILYIKDGIHYKEYNGTTLNNITRYIPTTSITITPSEGGTIYEEVNMLIVEETFYNKGLDLIKVKELLPLNTFTRKLNSFLPCAYY